MNIKYLNVSRIQSILRAEFRPEKQLKSVNTSGVVVVVVVVVEAVVLGNSPLFLSCAKILHENPVAVFLPLLRNFAITLKIVKKRGCNIR